MIRFLNSHKNKTVILKTEGGICSQIAFAALGKYFENIGYKVKYDITWFQEWGKGMDGVHKMNYDMDKAFPNLKLEIASEKEIEYYKKHYTSDMHKLKNKMYVSGFPIEREPLFIKYIDYFKSYFDPIDKENISSLINKIENSNSCAIHVRRGDLSKFNIHYGEPADIDYFIKAIKIIETFNKNVKFFFFSEEPEWIKENILPMLDSKINY